MALFLVREKLEKMMDFREALYLSSRPISRQQALLSACWPIYALPRLEICVFPPRNLGIHSSEVRTEVLIHFGSYY